MREIDGQAGQGRTPQRVTRNRDPALLEFARGIILTVPARAKRLHGGKAFGEASGTHQPLYSILFQPEVSKVAIERSDAPRHMEC